jgi:hypothetical protein
VTVIYAVAMLITCTVINYSTEQILHLHAQCFKKLILKYNSYTVTVFSIIMTLLHLVDCSSAMSGLLRFYT